MKVLCLVRLYMKLGQVLLPKRSGGSYLTDLGGRWMFASIWMDGMYDERRGTNKNVVHLMQNYKLEMHLSDKIKFDVMTNG